MVLAIGFATTFSTTSVAGVVGTGDVLTEQRADVDRQSLMSMLERQDVKNTLSTMGVDQSEVEKRIQSLTPSELADFNDSWRKRRWVRTWWVLSFCFCWCSL
jgi:hypothetical protein